MNQVKIYLTESCPYCIRAKQFLKQKQIPFVEIDLTHKPQELAELKRKTGWQTIPQIYFGTHFIGGYTDMVALDEKGELEKLLKD